MSVISRFFFFKTLIQHLSNTLRFLKKSLFLYVTASPHLHWSHPRLRHHLCHQRASTYVPLNSVVLIEQPQTWSFENANQILSFPYLNLQWPPIYLEWNSDPKSPVMWSVSAFLIFSHFLLGFSHMSILLAFCTQNSIHCCFGAFYGWVLLPWIFFHQIFKYFIS